MKRFLALIMSLTFVFALTACGDKRIIQDPEPLDTNSVSENSEEAVSADPLEVLTAVWDSYGEDEKFPVMGGDMSEENISADVPGKFTLEDPAVVDSSLGLPAADVDKLDSAASMTHMMNANTFTCGAFRVKSAGDVDTVVSDIKENIMGRQWMCGFPEKLVIVTYGDCIVSFFGAQDLTNMFRDKLTAAYSDAQVAVDEAIEI